MIETFKNEIIEAQKGRTDLLKWKLILVATLGAVGLGIDSSVKDSSLMSLDLTLCLIPLVCVYVDLLCKHLQMRILVIGSFFNSSQNKDYVATNLCFCKYEEFCAKARKVFDLEDIAQEWSTCFLSWLIILASYLKLLASCLELCLKHGLNWSDLFKHFLDLDFDLFALILSGFFGIFLTWYIHDLYEKKKRILGEEADSLSKKND